MNSFQINLFCIDEKIRVLIRTGATIDLAPIEILSMDAWHPSLHRTHAISGRSQLVAAP